MVYEWDEEVEQKEDEGSCDEDREEEQGMLQDERLRPASCQ